MSTVIFEREGIRLLETDSHPTVVGAVCECGEALIVAPPVFFASHQKGDPVVVCHDQGVHGYRWLELVPGQQPKGSAR